MPRHLNSFPEVPLFRHEYERLHYPPSTPQNFLDSMEKIMDEPVYLWLGSHANELSLVNSIDFALQVAPFYKAKRQ